ncbi:MAG: hypothetical protein F4219_02030 [Gammaproteobacteria bacterium]|nr:hypothetical protein [Gammaproteobacteria bacterium]
MRNLLGGKTLFTFETRKELFKFRWQWCLTLSIVLGATSLFEVHILLTLLFTASLFVAFFIGSYVALTKEVVTIIEEEPDLNPPV